MYTKHSFAGDGLRRICWLQWCGTSRRRMQAPLTSSIRCFPRSAATSTTRSLQMRSAAKRGRGRASDPARQDALERTAGAARDRPTARGSRDPARTREPQPSDRQGQAPRTLGSRRLCQPGTDGRPGIARLIEEILTAHDKWPLLDFVAEEHESKCSTSCYMCVQQYQNRRYHPLLDWRLGLA